MNKETGGPAFPSPGVVMLDGRQQGAYEGMTLRDWFAGLAMQAAATNQKGADGFTFYERARWAYEQADAMLEARK